MSTLALLSFAARHWAPLCGAGLCAAALASAARFASSDADGATLRAVSALSAAGCCFEGRVVLLVGASSGIGEALALALAERGATLVLAARRIDKLVEVAKRCMAAGSPDAMALRLDVLDTASHAGAVASLLKRYGRIDILVNNAGRSQRGLAERTPLAVDRDMFELNVFGVISLTKAVLPAMLEAGRGVIVTTSSVAGKTGAPISSTYAATKHALQGFMDSLRMEVGYRGVDVVNVCPGPVISEITQRAFTETAGKELGSPPEDVSSRMTAGAWGVVAGGCASWARPRDGMHRGAPGCGWVCKLGATARRHRGAPHTPGIHTPPPERCALLITAAIHSKLPEAWMAPQPILFYTYCRQFCPSLFFRLGKSAGRARVEAFQRGNTGYGSLSNPLSMLVGGGGGKGGEAKRD